MFTRRGDEDTPQPEVGNFTDIIRKAFGPQDGREVEKMTDETKMLLDVSPHSYFVCRFENDDAVALAGFYTYLDAEIYLAGLNNYMTVERGMPEGYVKQYYKIVVRD